MDRSHTLILALAGCVGEADPPSLADVAGVRADQVVSAPGHTGQGFQDVARAVNGVRGAGRTQGGTDVYSLSLDPDDELILGFEEPVFDAEGDELAVFENPFEVTGGGVFMDLVVVEASSDCERFVAFAVASNGADPTVWSTDAADWTGFAGRTPVELHEEDRPMDPLDPTAGGDRFDLADIGLDEVLCVRLTAAIHWIDARTGEPFPRDPISDGPDVDGVYGRP